MNFVGVKVTQGLLSISHSHPFIEALSFDQSCFSTVNERKCECVLFVCASFTTSDPFNVYSHATPVFPAKPFNQTIEPGIAFMITGVRERHSLLFT